MRADERQLRACEGRFDHSARENTDVDIPRNYSLRSTRTSFDKNRLDFDPMLNKKSQIMGHPQWRERPAKAREHDLERVSLCHRGTRQP